LDSILIDRFRSVHHHGRVTLCADLSSRPTPRWVRLCGANFTRYLEGFGELPSLVKSTIVVATTPRNMAESEMALQAVVDATNKSCVDGLVESS
jgi:hypothetical protein